MDSSDVRRAGLPVPPSAFHLLAAATGARPSMTVIQRILTTIPVRTGMRSGLSPL